MTAFNVVRFRVKPGREQEFLDAHKRVEAIWPGLVHANMIKTGERTFCIIAEWTDMDALANTFHKLRSVPPRPMIELPVRGSIAADGSVHFKAEQ